jgi:NAD(P)-dependent dehydrogenase (short-subunit alcohol dehydrogenase family)
VSESVDHALNAGSSKAGFFEEISPQDFRAQIETTLFGPVNLSRVVLPVMRAQRSGLVGTISSTAGIVGSEFCSAYADSKFGVEGWMESLTPELAPFGMHAMLVEPGFFRTELLTPQSTTFAALSIDDYTERTARTVAAWKSMNGQQGGDPAKLAAALVQLAGQHPDIAAQARSPMPLIGEYEPSTWPEARDQVELFEKSHGAEANTLSGLPVVVITTTGKSTRKLRKTPLMSGRSGSGSW